MPRPRSGFTRLLLLLLLPLSLLSLLLQVAHSPTRRASLAPPLAMPPADRSLSTRRAAAAAAAVVGGFVADAASMGLHWIYDGAQLAALVAAQPTAPEFHEPPACPFYAYASGAQSPYGDEVLPLLRCVAERGAFDAEAFGDASYLAAKAYTGRLNHVFKELVAKGDAGLRVPALASESADLHGAIKAPVLVARYRDAPLPELLATVRAATRVHQIGREAEDAAVAVALLLRRVLDGADVDAAVRALAADEDAHLGDPTRAAVRQVVEAVDARRFPDAAAAVGAFGKACGLPGSLQGALYALLATGGGFQEAVRANMLAGGDNCSRAIVVGAVAAAAAASQGQAEADAAIPEDWRAKTQHFQEIKALADQLIQ